MFSLFLCLFFLFHSPLRLVKKSILPAFLSPLFLFTFLPISSFFWRQSILSMCWVENVNLCEGPYISFGFCSCLPLVLARELRQMLMGALGPAIAQGWTKAHFPFCKCTHFAKWKPILFRLFFTSFHCYKFYYVQKPEQKD